MTTSFPARLLSRIPASVLEGALVHYGWVEHQRVIADADMPYAYHVVYRRPDVLSSAPSATVYGARPNATDPVSYARSVARVLELLLAYHGPPALARVWRHTRAARRAAAAVCFICVVDTDETVRTVRTTAPAKAAAQAAAEAQRASPSDFGGLESCVVYVRDAAGVITPYTVELDWTPTFTATPAPTQGVPAAMQARLETATFRPDSDERIGTSPT